MQKTTAEYLEGWLGWELVYAFNSEDFGSDGLLGRGSECEVVLTRPLREKLVANGVPSHNCIASLISRLSVEGFQACFAN